MGFIAIRSSSNFCDGLLRSLQDPLSLFPPGLKYLNVQLTGKSGWYSADKLTHQVLDCSPWLSTCLTKNVSIWCHRVSTTIFTTVRLNHCMSHWKSVWCVSKIGLQWYSAIIDIKCAKNQLYCTLIYNVFTSHGVKWFPKWTENCLEVSVCQFPC